MAGVSAEVVDVRGAFLTAEFDVKPLDVRHRAEGLRTILPWNLVLLLQRKLYGTFQVTTKFWKKLCQSISSINARRRKADVCLFFQRTSTGLLLCMSWVDDNLIAGRKEVVLQAKTVLKRHFYSR
jgi:hypothetical protein